MENAFGYYEIADEYNGCCVMKEITKRRREHLTSIGLCADDVDIWRQKWSNLRGDSRGYGRECKLTFEQYTQLAIDAGISHLDIGQSLDSYCMGRLGDSGDYELGNCRFITHRQNHKERCENGGTESMRQEHKTWNKYNKPHLAEASIRMKKNNPSKSDRVKKILSESWSKQLSEGRMVLDSNKGKHWFTNGIDVLMTFDCPSGWVRGRINRKNK